MINNSFMCGYFAMLNNVTVGSCVGVVYPSCSGNQDMTLIILRINSNGTMHRNLIH